MEDTLAPAVGSYGHSGYRPKFPRKFSRLLPCWSQQSGPVRTAQRRSPAGSAHREGSPVCSYIYRLAPSSMHPGGGSEIPPTHTPKKVPEKTGLTGQRSKNGSSQGALMQDQAGLRLPLLSPGLRPSQQGSPGAGPRHGLPSPFRGNHPRSQLSSNPRARVEGAVLSKPGAPRGGRGVPSPAQRRPLG